MLEQTSYSREKLLRSPGGKELLGYSSYSTTPVCVSEGVSVCTCVCQFVRVICNGLWDICVSVHMFVPRWCRIIADGEAVA